jgi:hypothetical protein
MKDNLTTPRSPLPYHHYQLEEIKSKQQQQAQHLHQHDNGFCNHPHHNHSLEKIKLVVDYSDNGSVKTRTSRLVDNEEGNFCRRGNEANGDARKRISSPATPQIMPMRTVRSPSRSPSPANHYQQASTRAQLTSNSFRRENYQRDIVSERFNQKLQQQHRLERSRSRSKSRSRSDLSNKCFLVKLISKNGPKSTSFF